MIPPDLGAPAGRGVTSGRSAEGGQAPRRTGVPTVQLLTLLTENIQGWTNGFFQAHFALGGLIWRPRRQLPTASARSRGPKLG